MYEKLIRGLMLLTVCLSVFACAETSADEPADGDGADLGVVRAEMRAGEGSCGGISGTSCSIACDYGSCSASAAKGGTVCCTCEGGQPSCR